MTLKERAYLVAEKCHSNQHYDIFPYLYHIRKVVQVAEELGYDQSIIVACILHDSMEDGDLSYKDIKTYFGEEVAEIVFAVTDELGRNRKERKAKTYPKIRANWKATVVKICDRIANVTHSKEFNSKMFEMYQKENEVFVSSIQSDEHPIDVQKAWNKLDSIFN